MTQYKATRILPERGNEFMGATLGDAERYANQMAAEGWRLHSMSCDSEGGTVVVMEREEGG